MQSEGPGKFKDFKLIRTKRVKPGYHKSSYKINLIKKPASWVKVIIASFTIIILFVILLNSDFYRIARIVYSLKDKNILIGFQNSAELRPTGGFWGSFAILETSSNFKNTKFEFETNPYKKSNEILKNSNEPLPEPMKEIFKDQAQSFVNANWQVDFPQTAKSLEWFLNQGWDRQVDGAWAISSLAVIDLLKLTGPITFNSTDIISSDNFTQFMSQKIDVEYWQSSENIKINEPKTILKDLSPILINKAKDLGFIKLYFFLKYEMKKGRILVFFNDNKTQNIANKMNITGEILPFSVDYLHINNANIGGNKTSLNIKQVIDYKVDRSDDQPIATLTISRSQSTDWPDHDNRNYTRVFVPSGSSLILGELDGENLNVTIDEENARTVFGFWFTTHIGQSKTVKLKYSLPFDNSLIAKYNLVYQKQPGTLPENLAVSINGKKIFNGIAEEKSKILDY